MQEAGRRGRHADADGHAGTRYVLPCSSGPTARRGIKASLDRAEEIGCDAVQLFAQSPRAWRLPDHDPADLKRFRERLEAGRDRGALVHALYLVNLATPNDDIYEKSASTLCKTVDAASAIGASGRLPRRLAPGRRLRGRAGAGRARDASGRSSAAQGDTWLLMENSAGTGNTIGRSIDELATIFDRLDGHPRLGVCLDSCHLFVSGVDVTDPKAYAAGCSTLDKAIGLDRLRALHVNDSQAPFDSNRDRHANVGEGEIGEQLGVFLAHPAVQGLPAVLETAGKRRPPPRRRGHPGPARPARPLDEAKPKRRWAKRAGQSRGDAPGVTPRQASARLPSGTCPLGHRRPGPAACLPPVSLLRKSARVGHDRADYVTSGRERRLLGARRANTRKLGRSSGSSKNSGLTQPSASPFAS